MSERDRRDVSDADWYYNSVFGYPYLPCPECGGRQLHNQDCPRIPPQQTNNVPPMKSQQEKA